MGKKLGIKNNRNKRAGTLAVTPCPSVAKQGPKKSLLLDDKNIDTDVVNHICGAKSFSQKAKEQGLYIAICAGIRKFRQDNRDSTFKQLRVYLVENFPTVFENISEHESNVSKMIAGDRGFSQAYFSSGLTLLELAEQRMYEVLEKEELEDNIKINAFDKVTKWEQAKYQLDKEQSQENGNNRVELNVNISVEDDDE